jgi:hypothetical protein
MKRLLYMLMLAPVLTLLPRVAGAVPVLQLDIAGGTYDPVTQTIVTSENSFTVYAYGTPDGNVSLATLKGTQLYLSIALTPSPGADGGTLGSFTVNGTEYFATSDMTFGVPPIEADGTAGHDGGDLGGHDIFETYFLEIPFQYTDASPTSGEYNTQDDAGQGPIAGDDMLYAAFDVDKTNLSESFQLHFDVYAKAPGQRSVDLDSGIFAPFSHDAGTRPTPEPTAALIFAVGLAATRYAGRRR